MEDGRMTDPGSAPAAEPVLGRFWLPGSADVVVHGQLTLGGEGPRLRLDGSLTPAMKPAESSTVAEESAACAFVDTNWEDEPSLTIHGDVVSGAPSESVTLIDGFTTGRTFDWAGWKVGPGVGQQRLQARYAVLGGHIAGDEEVFTGVRMRLRHLDEWAGLGGFGHSLAVDHASITFQRPIMPPAALSNGSLLHVDQDLSWARDGDSEKLTRVVWLRVDGHPPARWPELDRSLVTPLVTLLTLAVDADCAPVQVELAAGTDTGWLSLSSSGLSPPVERPRPAREMLLPLQALGLTAVAAWLDRVEDLGPLPPVVAAAVAKPPLTLETGLLELATVAEGLARRLWPEWNRFSRDEVGRAQPGVDEPDEVDRARPSALAAVAEHGETMSAAVKGALEHLHEPSYPQRLEKRAQYAGDAVPGVLGRLTEQGRPSRWKEAVVGARIDFAHRIDQGWLNEASVDRYLALYNSLRWLLTGVLLLETGLEPKPSARGCVSTSGTTYSSDKPDSGYQGFTAEEPQLCVRSPHADCRAINHPLAYN